MENSSQPFSYQPLDDDSIRLVTVKPGPWNSIIECEVEIENLRQGKNHFGALSYVWGDSNVRRPIHLNGNTFKVTVNLFEGLRQIRESMFEDNTLPQLPIWVDVTCINQDDKDEKAKQVPNMHQIYSTAEEVLLWLGVMSIPPDFLKPWTYDERYSWMGFGDEDCLMSEELRENALERYVVYIRSPKYSIQRLTLRYCTYFQRLWTVQEAVLAKGGPVILVSRHVLTWDEFTHKDRLEPEEFVEVSNRPHTSFLGISSLRKQVAVGRRQSPPERLLDVIQDFSEHTCSETVDKIYGLVAIVPLHGLPSSLWPDYSIPSEEVNWKYAQYLFAETGSLALLEWYTKPLPGVPSWVPAIGAGEGNISVTKSTSFPHSGPFWWMYPTFSADSREISIAGFDCGVCVEHMERPLAVAGPEDLQLVGTSIDLRDTLRQLEKQIDPSTFTWGRVTGT
ncbi:HET domain-containing protein [Fusarium falciforme]|uniref:HET domain-containing protein n=1 Tax=Fusarium falciforme TaxID=195108 RepID=UPI0023009217|nr:HET domain-containing protein [Fusarium falciforme]WAO95833.1 HET domain-containing protein [Fusarium falciforme]